LGKLPTAKLSTVGYAVTARGRRALEVFTSSYVFAIGNQSCLFPRAVEKSPIERSSLRAPLTSSTFF